MDIFDPPAPTKLLRNIWKVPKESGPDGKLSLETDLELRPDPVPSPKKAPKAIACLRRFLESAIYLNKGEPPTLPLPKRPARNREELIPKKIMTKTPDQALRTKQIEK